LSGILSSGRLTDQKPSAVGMRIGAQQIAALQGVHEVLVAVTQLAVAIPVSLVAAFLEQPDLVCQYQANLFQQLEQLLRPGAVINYCSTKDKKRGARVPGRARQWPGRGGGRAPGAATRR
jgi:hypothetical protein